MHNSLHVPKIAFEKQTLANGLDVIVRKQDGLPIVAVNLWYHVGSKNEERNQRGFAHLFEHLMFEGSQHFPGDFFKHLQPLGANINGSTSSDRTNYFVDLPAAHLERALAMESDRMANLIPALDESKLKIQKGVVKNEYRQNYANRPYGMVWSLMAEAMYPPQHPYNWLTIGVMEDLDSASLDDVSAFFQRYYVPANSSLSIVGDLRPDDAFSLAERYFGAIPSGSKAARPWHPAVGLERSAEIVLRERVELDRHYAAWHTVPHFHPDDAALGMLADILSRGKASRLYQKLVIERQLAQDVSAYHSSRELAGTFGAVITLRPSRSLEEARGVVLDEIRAIAKDGVTEAELARVRTMKTASFLFALEHIGGFGGVADRLNAYNVYRDDPSLITSDLDRFQGVTTAAIQDVAARYLDGKPSVGVSVLGSKPKAVAAPLDRKIVPQSGSPAAYHAPLPEILHLSNGIPVWVLPQRDLPTVTLAVAMAGGASLQPVSQPGLAQLSVSMMDEGTRKRTAAELALAAEAMGTNLSVSCGWDGAYLSFKSLRPLLEESLDLAIDVLREPSFPQPEWDRIQAQFVASLKAEKDSAEARAYRALLKAVYDEAHPYCYPLDGHEASVAGLSRDETAQFHARFLGPARAGIIVAGDIDAETIQRLLEQRLGDWTGPPVPSPAIAAPFSPSRVRILLLDKPGAPQAVVKVGQLGMARADADYDAALLMNQILGGQFTSRLNEKLREERGYTYGVRSQFDSRLGRGPFSIGASLQADKLGDALNDLHHELLELLGDRPPTEAELEKSRRSLIEGQTRHFETPGALVNRYAGLFIHSLPVDYYRTFAERLHRVSTSDLLTTARHRIQPDSLVYVVVADANSVESQLHGLGWCEVERIED